MKLSDKEFQIAGISEDAEVWYTLPDEFLDISHHTVLMTKKSVINATKAIKPVGGYRKIGVILDTALQK